MNPMADQKSEGWAQDVIALAFFFYTILVLKYYVMGK